MKTILSVPFIFLILAGAEANEVSVPPLDECQEIFISIESYAWTLRIKSDGSGSIQFGSLAGDGIGFPKETIDFAKFYQSLVPTLSASKTIDLRGERFGVAFQGKKSVGAYTREAGVIEDVFYKGLTAGESLLPVSPNRLEYLMLWHPPFRGPDDNSFWRLRTPEERTEMVKRLQVIVETGSDGYEQIGIYTRNGWKLTINTDGSGELSIGRHPGTTATLGPKTFDFSKTFKDRIQTPLQESFRIFIGEKVTKPATDKLSQGIIIGAKPFKKRMQPMLVAIDLLAVNELFDHAWQSANRPKKDPKSFVSMADVWRRQPPVELKAEPK